MLSHRSTRDDGRLDRLRAAMSSGSCGESSHRSVRAADRYSRSSKPRHASHLHRGQHHALRRAVGLDIRVQRSEDGILRRLAFMVLQSRRVRLGLPRVLSMSVDPSDLVHLSRGKNAAMGNVLEISVRWRWIVSASATVCRNHFARPQGRSRFEFMPMAVRRLPLSDFDEPISARRCHLTRVGVSG
jgi:hypothetical protein